MVNEQRKNNNCKIMRKKTKLRNMSEHFEEILRLKAAIIANSL